MQYEIVVRGKLGQRFTAAFGGMTIQTTGRETSLTGEVVDQAHLHGLLARIRALGIHLVSVTPIGNEARRPAGRGPPAA
jgi:hypothetical protein